jgi:hypothetical protein
MAHRSETEQRDEETGEWQLLDEIMQSIRRGYQSPDEVIEALITAMAKIAVQADFTASQVDNIKQMLDVAVVYQRALDEGG